MRVKIGTFNLNNLFSRFNFSAEIPEEKGVEVESKTTFNFDDPATFKLRTYQGRLIRGKPEAARERIAARIREMDLDVLAVQEVEDVDTLTHFARDHLRGAGYDHVVLVWRATTPGLIDADVGGDNPLRAAVWRGSLAVVGLLLDHGADTRVSDEDGRTPLEVAEAWADKDVEDAPALGGSGRWRGGPLSPRVTVRRHRAHRRRGPLARRRGAGVRAIDGPPPDRRAASLD